MPTLCSPLNGVLAPGHPRYIASVGELNQRPKWYICIGLNGGLIDASGNGPLKTTGADAEPGAALNVSMLKGPLKCWTASPSLSVWTSPWYQESPNGLLGTWIRKKSKPVFAGRSDAWIVMYSAVPVETTLTRAVAFGRHVVAPADTTISNEISLTLRLPSSSPAVAGFPAAK